MPLRNVSSAEVSRGIVTTGAPLAGEGADADTKSVSGALSQGFSEKFVPVLQISGRKSGPQALGRMGMPSCKRLAVVFFAASALSATVGNIEYSQSCQYRSWPLNQKYSLSPAKRSGGLEHCGVVVADRCFLLLTVPVIVLTTRDFCANIPSRSASRYGGRKLLLYCGLEVSENGCDTGSIRWLSLRHCLGYRHKNAVLQMPFRKRTVQRCVVRRHHKRIAVQPVPYIFTSSLMNGC